MIQGHQTAKRGPLKSSVTPNLCSKIVPSILRNHSTHALQPPPCPVPAGRKGAHFSAGSWWGEGERDCWLPCCSLFLCTQAGVSGRNHLWSPWQRGKTALARRCSQWTSSFWYAVSAWIDTGAPKFCLVYIPSVKGEASYWRGTRTL